MLVKVFLDHRVHKGHKASADHRVRLGLKVSVAIRDRKVLPAEITAARVMQTTANILDPIHDSLPHNVFDNAGSPDPKLKAQHAKWIRTTVEHALIEAGYTHVDQWLSLVLTGSLTTYQYDKHSDCDVSLFVDAEAFPEWSRADMIGTMVEHVDGTMLPGTSYPMQCFVVAKGIKKTDLYQPGLRSGWDIDKARWIEPPDRTRVHDVEREMTATYIYAEEQADKMERLLKYDPERAVMFWHAIHNRRRRDQMAGKGDYAESNIIYKFLANQGLFPQIAEVSGEYIAKTSKHIRVEAVPDDQGMTGRRDTARALWFDDDNGVVYLSKPGGVHTDVLNHFKLPFGGMWQAIAEPGHVNWMGMDKWVPDKDEVVNALRPYFESSNAPDQPQPEEGLFDFEGL